MLHCFWLFWTPSSANRKKNKIRELWALWTLGNLGSNGGYVKFKSHSYSSCEQLKTNFEHQICCFMHKCSFRLKNSILIDQWQHEACSIFLDLAIHCFNLKGFRRTGNKQKTTMSLGKPISTIQHCYFWSFYVIVTENKLMTDILFACWFVCLHF